MVKTTPEVAAAWNDLRDDASATKWVLYGYEDKKTIKLLGKGPGGRKACLAAVTGTSDIVFGGFVVTAVDDRSNTTSRRTKFVFFHYQAPDAPMMRRAAAGSHRTELQTLCAGSHVQFQVDALHELSEAEIVAKLRKCGGAHQPTGFDFGEGDVGEGAAEAAAAPAAPAKNARDFAADCVKAPVDAAAEHAARQKEYQTANVLNSTASTAAKAKAAAAAPAPVAPPPAPPVAAMAAATIAPPPAAPPAAPSGNAKVVVLVTSMPATTIIEGAQGMLRNIFRGKRIAIEEVDGLDPAQKERRNALFGVSGLRGQYPQVFIEQEGVPNFVGDYEKMTSLNDCEDLPKDILEKNPHIETFSTVFHYFLK